MQLPDVFQVLEWWGFFSDNEIGLSKPACPIIAALFQPLNFPVTLLS